MNDDAKYGREFTCGKNDWSGAAWLAGNCEHFTQDVEEELVAEESESCYNCRYRRWTTTSFTCQKRCLPPR